MASHVCSLVVKTFAGRCLHFRSSSKEEGERRETIRGRRRLPYDGLPFPPPGFPRLWVGLREGASYPCQRQRRNGTSGSPRTAAGGAPSPRPARGGRPARALYPRRCCWPHPRRRRPCWCPRKASWLPKEGGRAPANEESSLPGPRFLYWAGCCFFPARSPPV